jgi:hypothetical protein
MSFLWLLDFRWWLVCAGVALVAMGFGAYEGHKAADKSAEIARLNTVIETSNATIEALQESTRRSNAASAAYAKRETMYEQALAVDDEVIDKLSEQQNPSETVCYLTPAEFNLLRDQAIRASRGAGGQGGTSVNVRKAGPGSTSNKK